MLFDESNMGTVLLLIPFITRRVHIGMTPYVVRSGDVVCIFLNAKVPHVLRARAEGERGYNLVGDVFYVYGVMDGELLKQGHEHVNFEVF